MTEPQHLMNPERPEVLIVESSEKERQVLEAMVKQWGYKVSNTDNGQDAIHRASQHKIQLVLAGWDLNGLRGVDLCVKIRELQAQHYIYVILISPQQAEEFLIEALQSGADDVLTEPVDPNELEARLKSAERRIELQTRLAAQNHELHQAYDAIARDLRVVSRVQRSYLPEVKCPFSDMDYSWLTLPSQYVSGDHLHAFKVSSGVYGFYLLDVSGHGIPAAVKSMQLVAMFSDQAASSVVYHPAKKGQASKEPASPRDVVARLNSIFQQTESDLSYFTLIYGLFEPQKNKVTFCQAGHPSPLLLKANGEVKAIGRGGYPVGLFDFDEFEDEVIELHPGDSLMLYSDGVTEVLSEDNEQFGEARLLSSVQVESSGADWKALPNLIGNQIKTWGGRSVQEKGFEDDVSILMISHASETSEPRPNEAGIQVDALEARDLDEPVFVSAASSQDKHITPLEQVEKKSVLIVDDSRSFLRIFQAMLTSWGYDVTPAQSGHEALALLSEYTPDFVLTDWDMPGMSGIELCEQIRSNQSDDYAYIIMITGYASRDDLLRSLRVGSDDFLTKPVNPSELKVRLTTAERIASLHSDLARKRRQISELYESLQRDMREVSRVQRSLLPKNVSSPWPVAVQGLFKPMGYVSGKQYGTLKTRSNELGFFMLSLPGSDTSSALKAMALSRWISVERATQLLFPPEEVSVKMRRYLADPEVVWRHLQEITPTLADTSGLDFDLLYGLLNLDQGTLLVGGIGQWELVVAHPREATRLVSSFNAESKPRKLSNGRYASVLYQDVIRPGSRLFVMPQTCADDLNLAEISDWEERILICDQDDVSINDELSRLSTRVNNQGNHDMGSQIDLTLMALQWREHFELQFEEPTLEQVQAYVEFGRVLAEDAQSECLVSKPLKNELGAYRDMFISRSVIDPVSIAKLSQKAKDLAESLGFSESVVYNVDLALAESLTNIMNHTFAGKRPLPTELSLVGYDDAVVIIIRDQGSRIPQVNLDHLRPDMSYMDDLAVDQLPEGGMGLTFISMVSSRFRYRSTEDFNELALLVSKDEL